MIGWRRLKYKKMKRLLPIVAVIFLLSACSFRDSVSSEEVSAYRQLQCELVRHVLTGWNISDTDVLNCTTEENLSKLPLALDNYKDQLVEKKPELAQSRQWNIAKCCEDLKSSDLAGLKNSLCAVADTAYSIFETAPNKNQVSLRFKDRTTFKAYVAEMTLAAYSARICDDELMRAAFKKKFPEQDFKSFIESEQKPEKTALSGTDTKQRKFELNTLWNTMLYAIALLLCGGICVVLLRRHNKNCVASNSVAPSASGQSGRSSETMGTPVSDNPVDVSQEPSDVTEKTDTEYEAANSFAFDDDKWIVVGASIRGNGHASAGLPCQDNCSFRSLGDGWGIAISSDGAGSAENSATGSKIVVSRGLTHFESLVLSRGWKTDGKLPSDAEWMNGAYTALKAVYNDMSVFAREKGIDVGTLNATAIVLIYSPFGVMVTHIGDGRCGYRNSQGEWLPLITPHKGDEANQTIFVSSDFWSIPNYVMSGQLVPESRVLRVCLTGFVLMSDGCEATAWLCNQYDSAVGRYCDPNLPFSKFFDSVSANLIAMHGASLPLEERKSAWEQFLAGNGKFAKEQDDKTMILAVLNMYNNN